MKKRSRKTSSHWTRLGHSMTPGSFTDDGKRRLRSRVLGAAIVLVGVWLTFFDSHSLLKRFGWHREYTQISAENAALEAEIDRLQKEIDRGLSDEMVEKIAREQYGMRRPGETVYPVESDE